MMMNLDQKALVHLVKGIEPSYDVMNLPIIKDLGEYSGSYGHWDWNIYKLEECSEIRLCEVYITCRRAEEREDE